MLKCVIKLKDHYGAKIRRFVLKIVIMRSYYKNNINFTKFWSSLYFGQRRMYSEKQKKK